MAPTATAPLRPARTLDDAPAVQQTLAMLAPRWTTWTLQTIAQRGEATRFSDLKTAMPWISDPSAAAQLRRLTDNGLILRGGTTQRPHYTLTMAARALAPLHRQAEQWARTHLPATRNTAAAQCAEDTLTLLGRSHTATLLWPLEFEPATWDELQDDIPPGISAASAQQRLQQLVHGGLVERSKLAGYNRFSLYSLTEAGQALGPIYDTLNQWTDQYVLGKAPQTRSAAPRTAPANIAPTAQEAVSRHQAAAARSAAFALPFSHPDTPQPTPVLYSPPRRTR